MVSGLDVNSPVRLIALFCLIPVSWCVAAYLLIVLPPPILNYVGFSAVPVGWAVYAWLIERDRDKRRPKGTKTHLDGFNPYLSEEAIRALRAKAEIKRSG